MAYRERSRPDSSNKRVELLAFAPTSKRWIAWALLAAAFVVSAALNGAERRAAGLAWTALLALGAWIRALASAAAISVSLERDERGRALCVRHSLFGFGVTRRWPTESTPKLSLEQTTARDQPERVLSIRSSVKLGVEQDIPLFSTHHERDATAFRAAAKDFAVKAERLLGDESAFDASEVDASVVERMTGDRSELELGATASPDALGLAGYGAPSPDGDDRERYRQHVEVVRVLLDAGVDASAANRDGVPARTALDDAGPEMAALAEKPSRRE